MGQNVTLGGDVFLKRRVKNIKIVTPVIESVTIVNDDPARSYLYPDYICPECEHKIYDHWSYCPYCGSMLRWKETSETNAIKRLFAKIAHHFMDR